MDVLKIEFCYFRVAFYISARIHGKLLFPLVYSYKYFVVILCINRKHYFVFPICFPRCPQLFYILFL